MLPYTNGEYCQCSLFLQEIEAVLFLSVCCFTESDTCPVLCPVFCCLWGPEPAVGLCRSSACAPADRVPRRECRTPTLCSLCLPALLPGAPGTSGWTLSGAARVLSPVGALRTAPAPRTPAPDSHCPWQRSRTERSRSRERAALQSVTLRAALRASPPCWRRPPSAHTPSVYARPFWPL